MAELRAELDQSKMDSVALQAAAAAADRSSAAADHERFARDMQTQVRGGRIAAAAESNNGQNLLRGMFLAVSRTRPVSKDPGVLYQAVSALSKPIFATNISIYSFCSIC